MNDIFIEQLVKRKRPVKSRIIFIFAILMVILVPLTLVLLSAYRIIIPYFIYISFFAFLFGIWFLWYIRSHQNVEFEYQMVQDTLVVSKIIAKRKRKEMLRLDVRTIDILAKGNEPELQKLNFNKVYDAAINSNDDENTYYAVYQHAGYGRCALQFNPEEKVLNAMKPYLKKDIVLKIFYHRG